MTAADFKQYWQGVKKQEKEIFWAEERLWLFASLVAFGVSLLVFGILFLVFGIENTPRWLDIIYIVLLILFVGGVSIVVGVLKSRSRFTGYLSFLKLSESIRKDLIDRSETYEQYKRFEEKKQEEGEKWSLLA